MDKTLFYKQVEQNINFNIDSFGLAELINKSIIVVDKYVIIQGAGSSQATVLTPASSQYYDGLNLPSYVIPGKSYKVRSNIFSMPTDIEVYFEAYLWDEYDNKRIELGFEYNNSDNTFTFTVPQSDVPFISGTTGFIVLSMWQQQPLS